MSEPLYDVGTLWELVDRRAELSPDGPMLIDDTDTVVTFGAFRDRALRVAAGLVELGIGPGTHVTWQLPTKVDTIVVSMALARLGAIQNPILHLYRHKEVGFALGATHAEFFVVPGTWRGFDYAGMGETLAAGLDPAPRVLSIADGLPEADPSSLPPAPTDPDEVRWIYFTSGTTSDPKGVQHTDGTLLAGGKGLAVALGMSSSDVGSMAFPFAHIAGPDYLVTMLANGFPAVLLEAFNLDTDLPLLQRSGTTMVGGSTAFYQMYLTRQRTQPDEKIIPTLRVMSGGGAPMPPEIYGEVKREMGIKIAHGYGMTEIPMISQGSPSDDDEQLAHSVGKPVVGADIRIVTLEGEPAPQGVDGEVRVKGPMVCRGYTDPAATAEAFDEDGYFRTGDVGHLRPDGHVVLTGRLKDVIIRKGENISAKEIEDLLYGHPKVGDIAVIGLPDRERGERVCAVVEQAPGAEALTFDEMQAHLVAAGLMRQKIPEQLEVVDELPRNETLRKVLKHKLRETYGAKPWP